MFSGPPQLLAAFWILWILQASWCCFNAWAFINRANRWQRRLDWSAPQPRTVVIMPIKGADDHLAAHVAELRRQNYAAYRIIFVVESQQDPAHAALQRMISDAPAQPGPPIELIVAGLAERGGQKVHNLIAAVRSLRDDDKIIAFADADAAAHPQWLTRLVMTLLDKHVGASTGYRWLVPAPGSDNLPCRLASQINASVATLLGRPRHNFAWGGSMAITRQNLIDSKLLERWNGALSDDYQLTRAVEDLGKVVQFVPGCLVTSPARFTWTSLLEFTRRQYLITRIHAPLIWLAAIFGTALYTAGWISVLTAVGTGTRGRAWGLAAWVIVYLLDIVRAHFRSRAVRQLLGDEAANQLRPVLTLDRWATPFWMLAHLLLILRSTFGKRIQWGRITYDIHAPQDVRIITRD